MTYPFRNIEIKRIAVGIQSNDNAPSEEWYPSEHEPEMPDGAKLKELLSYAKRKLVGRPISIMLAVIYAADGVAGKQLNRSISAEEANSPEALESLRDEVLEDCILDAEKANV
ncbi:hypothetical protein [Microcoleus sp. B7-D4]|uniref:hypothetical protein n=1 Tax=Microcoleus sp. B7-D4 TaxID=2818696 RepID=UPI002FD2EFED